MQRGARFAIFDVPFGAPCWAQQGRQKRYKITVCLLIFKMKGTTLQSAQAFPCSVALVLRFAGALPCSVVLV